MTVHTIKSVLVMFLVNHVFVGTRCFERKRKLLNSIGYVIGEGTKIVGPIFCTGKLTVGKDCWIGKDLTIHGNGTVLIGDHCDIAPEVMFLTGGHAVGTSQRRGGAGQSYRIHVEDGCWIGARATLGKDIRIEKGSVVGACACVMQDVPQDTMVGGVPAREIRSLHET